MNRITRNLAVLLLAAVSSSIVAAIFIFIEVRFGRSLYSYTAWSYVPAGAIGAGLLFAAGYYLGSRLLRTRPPRLMIPALVLLSAASVFLMDSAEYGLLSFNRKSITSVASAGQFLGYSLAHTPLKFWPTGGGNGAGANSGSSGSGAAPGVSVAGDSNPGVEGIGGGVQGMLASGNALSADNISDSLAGAKQRIAGLQALGSGALTHGAVLELAGLQLLGFVIGGLLAFFHLRSLSYCEDCGVFLSKKGRQTRYFIRERDIQGSVDEFLTRAKARRYKQSVEAHAGEGSAERSKLAAFASTVEISRCKACHRHQLKFSARRKKGITWHEISMLGYTAFCMEPLEVTRNFSPTRIR